MKHYVWVGLLALVVTSIPAASFSAGNTLRDAVDMMDQGHTVEAIELCEKLAANGDDRAMVQLGLYYHQGDKVQQDYDKAMDWFLRAFARQNAAAFVYLGAMHYEGHGVPQNKKIAYGVFLTTHMGGLGSQATQLRSNRYLRRILNELSREDVKDCLSHYTLGYISAYLDQKGKLQGIPEQYKPSEQNPALKDLGWFLDSELDAIYGEPTEEEQLAREERNRKRQNRIDALRHTLVFQVRFPKDNINQYRSYEVITDNSMQAGPIPWQKLHKKDDHLIFEYDCFIYAKQNRFVTIENDRREALVFRIDHPVQPAPCGWSAWQKAAYILENPMESFALLHGREPGSKKTELPPDAPELRFRVVKP